MEELKSDHKCELGSFYCLNQCDCKYDCILYQNAYLEAQDMKDAMLGKIRRKYRESQEDDGEI